MTTKDSSLEGAASAKAGVSVQGIDYKALFERLPSPFMIVDCDLRYVEVNQAYLETLERSREDLIGRSISEVFPAVGESDRLLKASFARVLKTGQRDTIALIPYPIERPASRGGGLEMRYWSAVHTPLLDETGKVAFIVQNTVEVTELQRLKEMAYGPGVEPQPGESALLERAAEVQQVNVSLMEETGRLRDLFMQAPGFMALLSGPDLKFTLVNHAYMQLVGHREIVGLPLATALPEVVEQGFLDLLQGVMRDRQAFVGRALSIRLQRTPDAPLEERFLDFIYQPILDAEGAVAGVFVEGSDVTDRIRGEQQQKLLLDELNHRVKNALATVQSIAAQTLRSNPEPAAFREAFESRLMALSATHDILTAANWRSADLRDVLAVEFQPYGAERYDFQGPRVDLSASQALTLGLLFHELATNAAKYGALSTAEGCVRIDWSVTEAEGERRLVLNWKEEGGPVVTPVERRGFGSRLIERSLQGEMGGGAVLEFHPAGLRCRIVLPLGGSENGLDRPTA